MTPPRPCRTGPCRSHPPRPPSSPFSPPPTIAPERVYPPAPPASLPSFSPPIPPVSPSADSATAEPTLPPPLSSGGTIFVCSLHVDPERVYTHAAPNGPISSLKPPI